MSSQSAEHDEEILEKLLQRIPKFEDFGDVLENLTPLKGGRRANTLVTFSKQTEDKRRLTMRQVRDEFNDQLQYIDNVDEPLEIYLQHLRWTYQFFPQGDSRDSELGPLLQQTTDAFKDDTRYKDDPRYLKCWLERAWRSDDPKGVFFYLAKKGIGQKDASYYEQYSIYYELCGKYTEARHILETGIKCQVDIGKLQKSLEQLNNRIEHNTKTQQQQGQRTPIQHQLQSRQYSDIRKMLGHKHHSRDGHSMSQREFNNRQNIARSSQLSPSIHTTTTTTTTSRRSFGNATPTTTILTSLSSTTRSEEPAKIRVYQDEDPMSSPMETVFPTTRTTATTSTESLPNSSISSISRKRQENTIPSEPFAGAKLPQKPTLIKQPPTKAFDVFRDDATPAPPPSSSSLSSSLSSSSLSSAAVVALTSLDPPNYHLLNHTETFGVASSRHRTTTISGPATSPTNQRRTATLRDRDWHMIITDRLVKKEKDYVQHKSSKGKAETIAVHDDCLGVGGFANKLTFEELRILKQVDRHGEPQVIEKAPESKLEMTPSEAVIRCRIGRGRSPTREYTAETKGAMDSIDALFNKQQHDDDGHDDDDIDDDTNPRKKRIRRTCVNENS